jgi:uncharacterized protein YggE
MQIRIAAAVAAASLILAPAATAATAAATPGTLTVDGNGSVMVAPDVASLTVTVTRSAPASSAALSAANSRVKAIVGAIRGIGVPASGIQTESINVSPGSSLVGTGPHRHRVRRYTATESLSITSTATIAGRVIDTATRAGASGIDGPYFSFSNQSAGMVAATNAALADARTRANAAAATLGYTVTGVQSVNLDPQSNVVYPTGASGSASAPPTSKPTTPTNVHAGTVEVDATVEVVYTIAPAA